MKEYPAEIYLQVVPDDSEYYEPGTITWCEDKINSSDVKYIRSDRIDEAKSLVDQTIEVCERLKHQYPRMKSEDVLVILRRLEGLLNQEADASDK